MNIDLLINLHTISLGSSLDKNYLSKSQFKKAGFFLKFMTKIEKGETVYWAKNCNIECFESAFSLLPITNRSLGSALIFGTSAYLFFKKRILKKVIFQIIYNKHMALKYTTQFRFLCEKNFGKPTTSNDPIVSWEDSDTILISEWSPGNKHSYFHWYQKF